MKNKIKALHEIFDALNHNEPIFGDVILHHLKDLESEIKGLKFEWILGQGFSVRRELPYEYQRPFWQEYNDFIKSISSIYFFIDGTVAGSKKLDRWDSKKIINLLKDPYFYDYLLPKQASYFEKYMRQNRTDVKLNSKQDLEVETKW